MLLQVRKELSSAPKQGEIRNIVSLLHYVPKLHEGCGTGQYGDLGVNIHDTTSALCRFSSLLLGDLPVYDEQSSSSAGGPAASHLMNMEG